MQTDRRADAATRPAGNDDKLRSQPNVKATRTTWLPYGRQSISEEDINAVVEVLRSDWLTQGPKIAEFEEAIAAKCGVKYAVAVSNGTTALHAAYFAAGVGDGDEIVTSAITFAATANAALYLNATPKFADIEPATGNICAQSAASLVTKKTRAVVGIDFAGHPCEADELRALAHSAGAALIIDGAHSLGASYKGQPAGSLADMTTLSLHAVKTITTGEGGMILTDSADYAHKLQLFRTHGIEKDAAKLSRVDGPWYHEMQFLGNNYRITDMQAALGLSQLKRLDQFIERRRAIADQYRQYLAQSKRFAALTEKPHVRSAYHLFPILIQGNDRKQVVEALHQQNIGVQVHYIPTYSHPYYVERFGNVWQEKCPHTEDFYSRVLSLPLFPAMTDSDVNDVIEALDRLS